VRRAVFALTEILVIVTLMQPMAQVSMVEAKPFTFGSYIGILSPEQFNKKTYQTSTIPIEIQIETPPQYPKIIKIYYILDLNYSSNHNPQKSLSIANHKSSTYSGVSSISYLGTGTLRNLNNGTHTIDAYAVDAQDKNIKSSTRNFLVNTTSIYPAVNSEQPSNLTIAPVISTIAIIGTSLTVLAYKRTKKLSDGYD